MPFTDSINIVDVVVADRNLLNATPADVAQGKQFIGTTQHIESGTIPVNSTRTGTITLTAGSTLNVPYGINPESYTVKAQDLSNLTPSNATADDIIINKTAWVNGTKVTGEMPDNGSENDTLLCGASHRISRGYHDGNGVIVAKDLMSQTKASIVAEDIKKGSYCWANGKRVDGTMTVNKSTTNMLVAGGSYTIPEGYHDGRGVVNAAELAVQTNGTAYSEVIVEGYTAWVNGEQVTGSIKKVEPEVINFTMNSKYYIPKGYHTGDGYIIQNVPDMDGQTVAPAKEAQTIKCGGFYMNSNITISGVDALNYQFPNSVVKDSNNNDISNYTLSVSDNTAIVKIYVDNWHDNATLNVYNLVFSDLIDINGNNTPLSTMVMMNWRDQTEKTYTFGNINIKTKLENGTNAHTITISGINSGKLNIIEVFSSREFGVKND